MVIGKVVLKALAVFLLLQATAFAQEGKDMSPALRKQLNVFLSNFSEVNLQNFKKGQLSDKMLVDFALWHCTFNLTNTLKKSKDGAHALADASLIDNISMRYFGVKPGKHKVQTYDVDLASGEAYIFSQVDKLTKVNQDTYTAQGTIYYTGSGGTPDPHGTPAIWKKQGEDVRVYGTFTGQIKKVASPKEHYVLEAYEIKLQ